MLRGDVWRVVRHRASDAGIEMAIGCRTFRAIGITDYLTNGGVLRLRNAWPGTRTAKIAGLYDRRNDDIGVREVGRIGIWRRQYPYSQTSALAPYFAPLV
jgi:hypothetical protein